jgi:hypothetical protein
MLACDPTGAALGHPEADLQVRNQLSLASEVAEGIGDSKRLSR